MMQLLTVAYVCRVTKIGHSKIYELIAASELLALSPTAGRLERRRQPPK